MKKTVLLGAIAGLMVASLALFGCGGGSGNGGGQATKTAEANIAPSAINPGERTNLNEYSDVSGTSDMWYVDGDSSKGGVYFRLTAVDDSVLTVVFVDAEGNQVECTANSEADNHLKSAEGSEVSYDILFDDPFTCYDAVSDTWYKRGDMSYDDVYAAFAGKTFANDNFEFTFNEDGTFTQAKVGSSSDPIQGEWAIMTPYLWTDVADPTYTYDYDYAIENGELSLID